MTAMASGRCSSAPAPIPKASGASPASIEKAIMAVFSAVQRHVGEAETAKVRHALPEDIRTLWRPDVRTRKIPGGNGSIRVADVMSRDVCLVSPDHTLEETARYMAEQDLGFLPVGANDRLVGTITDRDIVARAVARAAANVHARDLTIDVIRAAAREK